MANSVTVQVLQDGPRNVVLHVTGVLDTSNLAATVIADVSTFDPVPTLVRIDRMVWSCSDPLAVQLFWDATTDVFITELKAQEHKQDFKDVGGIHNNAGAGVTGDIVVTTTGWTAGTEYFTIDLWLVKSGVQ